MHYDELNDLYDVRNVRLTKECIVISKYHSDRQFQLFIQLKY